MPWPKRLSWKSTGRLSGLGKRRRHGSSSTFCGVAFFGEELVPKPTDPMYGMYFMKLRCKGCGAPKGVNYPATGIPKGTVLVHRPGDKGISLCRRCGKAQMEVVNEPPPPPKPQKPPGWKT
jgi:hypothetical protein